MELLGVLLTIAVAFVSLLVEPTAAVQLVPIEDASAFDSPGLIWDKRDASDDTEWDLKNEETFYWGTQASRTDAYMARLTLRYPREFENVISMNRFAKHLQAVDCKDPGLKLDFKDKKSFESAKKSWHWVNGRDQRYFVMVTDYAGCGPDNTRQPFIVTDVHYDEVKFIAHLKAKATTWEKVAHSYSLRVGHVPTRSHGRLAKRIGFGGGTSLSTEQTFNGDWFTTEADGLEITMGCLDCSTTGKVNFEFNLDVGFTGINSADLKVSPSGVSATMELGAKTEGSLNTAWGWEKSIVSIPLEGIEVGDFVKIGGFFDVDAGVKIGNWTGSVEAGLGAKASLSDSAILEVDLVNSDNTQISGWTPTIEPIPFHVSAKVECEAEAYIQPALKLSAEAFKKGWEVELGLRMPYVKATAALKSDTAGGVCEGSDATLGVEADVSIGIDLSASAATAGNGATPFWKYTILDQEWPLAEVCIPFGGEPTTTTTTSSSSSSSTTTAYTSTMPYSSFYTSTLPVTSSYPTFSPTANLTRFAI